MTDDQLRRVAATRPGYATYPTTRPGSPSWWRRPVDGVPPGRPRPRPASLADELVAHHGTPMVAALDDARDRYETEKRDVRAAVTEAVDTGKAVWLPGGGGYIEPEPRRWWHRAGDRATGIAWDAWGEVTYWVGRLACRALGRHNVSCRGRTDHGPRP